MDSDSMADFGDNNTAMWDRCASPALAARAWETYHPIEVCTTLELVRGVCHLAVRSDYILPRRISRHDLASSHKVSLDV